LSEPNEPTVADAAGAAATAPDATPDTAPQAAKTVSQTPFWKRWLGKA
jgi:hypothetical protein